jgi:hypothetical protein
MARNFDYAAKLIYCVGRQGRGKSFLQRQLIREFPARWKIIFDHKGEFALKLPAQRCISYEQCALALDQTQSCVFDPRPKYGSDHEATFHEFCKKMNPVMESLDGAKALAFDEAALLLPDNWKNFKKHPVFTSCNDGRSWGVNVIFAGQAPTDITLKFRNQITNWFVFNLGCEEAAEPLYQYGYTWDSVKALDLGEFIAYDHNAGKLFPKAKL